MSRSEAVAVLHCLRDELPAAAVVLSDHQTLQLLVVLLDGGALRFCQQGTGGLCACQVGARNLLYLAPDTERLPTWSPSPGFATGPSGV